MCGLIGEVTSSVTASELFGELQRLSVSRGPDQQGYWTNHANCQMGFNRLAILDVSENGLQPMVSPSGRYVMVFNGEIYNYRDLQLEYHINSASLRSTSDAEVLVHLIEKLSIGEFVSVLNGMFAICIYDSHMNEVHLIRDFAGIKPLFYGVHDTGIVFSSQFDQVFKHPLFKGQLELRPEIMKEYFGLGYMHAPNTVFKNIFQVRPGEWITWSDDTKTIVRKKLYYTWTESDSVKETDPELPLTFIDEFTRIISDQLNADVKVAAFLSGGIDSPLVAAISHQLATETEAFTFGIRGDTLDESQDAKALADQIGIAHTIETVSRADLLNSVNDHFSGMPEPFGDYSSLPTYLITKKASAFAQVMMSGDGGDEMFWGYPRFMRAVDHFNWFRIPQKPAGLLAKAARRFNNQVSSAVGITGNFGEWTLSKQIHLTDLDSLFPDVSFSSELMDDYSSDRVTSKRKTLRYLKKNEFYGHLQKVLRKVDLMSMANSLEVRVPFLDKRMIAFSNNISPELTLRHRDPKIVLKKALKRLLPSADISDTKRGFTVPVDHWLRNELREDVEQMILHQPIYGAEHLDSERLKQLVMEKLNDSKGNLWGIWHVYAWQKWAYGQELVIK